VDNNKNYSLLKGLGILLLTVFGLWLIYDLIFETGNGISIVFRGNYGGGHMYMNYGYGLTGTIEFLLLFLIKVLFVLFIVGLIVGIAIEIKNIFTTKNVEKIKAYLSEEKQ
jgi:hypothetical protein